MGNFKFGSKSISLKFNKLFKFQFYLWLNTFLMFYFSQSKQTTRDAHFGGLKYQLKRNQKKEQENMK